MHGADAIVLGGGEDERFGIVAVGLELVVGRDGGEELALFGNGDGAVFADPGGSGGDVLEAEHVEERDLDDDGVPHLGVLRELDAHEEAAVGAADDAEAAGRGDLAGEHVLADRGEVVVDELAVGFEAGLVPCGAELAATPDVGEDVDAAALEPQLADDAGVAWASRRPGSRRRLSSGLGWSRRT